MDEVSKNKNALQKRCGRDLSAGVCICVCVCVCTYSRNAMENLFRFWRTRPNSSGVRRQLNTQSVGADFGIGERFAPFGSRFADSRLLRGFRSRVSRSSFSLCTRTHIHLRGAPSPAPSASPHPLLFPPTLSSLPFHLLHLENLSLCFLRPLLFVRRSSSVSLAVSPGDNSRYLLPSQAASTHVRVQFCLSHARDYQVYGWRRRRL